AYATLAVRNWASPETTTGAWFAHQPRQFCRIPGAQQRHALLTYACEHKVPLAEAVLPVAAQRGDRVRMVLVNAQGTNDAHNQGVFTPEITVDNIARWPKIVAPVPVLISPPFNRHDTAGQRRRRRPPCTPGAP